MEKEERREVICPHCHQVFTVNESEYASLLNQISKQEIDREVHEKLALANQAKEKEIELAQATAVKEMQAQLSAQEVRITELKAKAEREIARLKAEKMEVESGLKAQLENAGTKQELAVAQAVSSLENKCSKLESQLQIKENEQKMAESSLKEKYELQLRGKDDMIAYYKDLKARMSTKMVGESLEQHCENQFNQIRATAFPRAYFEKDNQVSETGSKGDFIYREQDENGVEILSIMFEMKNENETTATKHKNEDFLKELDKDRREKGCEYAILVSMLEAESELYNTGIVDVSYKYEKMYVIRPQFFIPMITILRNAALNSLQYKAELAEVREQNIDITNFEGRIEDWKRSFSVNSERAAKNFQKAIKEIEDSIKKLENTRDALQQTVKNFTVANNKLDDLTVKRLTRGNPTMTAKFAELEK